MKLTCARCGKSFLRAESKENDRIKHEAAAAYDRAAVQHFGEFAKTNFSSEANPS